MSASPRNVKLSLIANAVQEIDSLELQDELILIASSCKDLLENMNDYANDSDRLKSEEEYTEVADSPEKTACKNFFSRTFKLLSEYRLCAAAYENLYAAYNFIVTLKARFHYEHGKENSLFILLIFPRLKLKQALSKAKKSIHQTKNNLFHALSGNGP